jgi:hypothetical protein
VAGVAAANRSRKATNGGHRPTIGFGGRRSWVEVRLSWPIVVLMVAVAIARWMIRMRIELSVLTGLVLTTWWLSSHVGGWRYAVLLLVWVLLVLIGWPAGRNWLVAHAWCMFSRHRVRTALGQAGVASTDGRIPYMLRVRPTPVGTRVTVWMRAGTAVEQLGDDDSVKVGIVRAACWAREVRIERNPRWSHVVTLHLVRHDSLAPSVSVASTLPDLLRAAVGVEQPGVVRVPTQSTGARS